MLHAVVRASLGLHRDDVPLFLSCSFVSEWWACGGVREMRRAARGIQQPNETVSECASGSDGRGRP